MFVAKKVVFTTCTRLSCISTTPPPSVFLCLSDTALLAPKICPEGGNEPFPFTTLEATLTKSWKNVDNCNNVCFSYTFSYDENLLADPLTALLASQITGVFCEGCLTTWVSEQVGDEITLVDNGNGTATLTSQHGCETTISTGGGAGSWIPEGVTTATVGGIPAGTDLGTLPTLVQTTLIQMFYPATPPSIVLLADVPGGVREFGNPATASVNFSANTTQGTNPITLVEFYANAGLIYTVPVPIPNGGLETDPNAENITSNTTFNAHVGDGVLPFVVSNTISYQFVFAYFYGVGAPGLTPAQVAALTKNVIPNTLTVARIFNPVNQVYYFAYPDSYPALVSILDTNGFETLPDWSVSTGNSITNTFGQTTTYRIYQFNNLTTQVAFTNTFIE